MRAEPRLRTLPRLLPLRDGARRRAGAREPSPEAAAVDRFQPPAAPLRTQVRSGAFAPLQRAAKASLEANIEELAGHRYVTAGRNQFKSLWTRDFALAVPGLLAAGHAEVVRDQLTLLLDNLRPSDGLVPRTVDSMDAKKRVTLATVRRVLPFLPNPALRAELEPEYQDQHGSPGIDGNLLVVKGALDYVAATGDLSFWTTHAAKLQRAFDFYGDKLDSGLVVQPPFSDWQDSVRREGKTFYTNLLYASVLERLAKQGALGVKPARASAAREAVQRTFFDADAGVYRSVAGEPYVSLDANLLAIDQGFLPRQSREAKALYAALKRHPVWKAAGGLPGSNTVPDYPKSWRHAAVRLVGLSHYHDSIVWSWLGALSAKVAAEMGDDETASALLSRWTEVVTRDGGVGEIYRPTPELPRWRSFLYHSEQPFTWGAAMFADALHSLDRRSGT